MKKTSLLVILLCVLTQSYAQFNPKDWTKDPQGALNKTVQEASDKLKKQMDSATMAYRKQIDSTALSYRKQIDSAIADTKYQIDSNLNYLNSQVNNQVGNVKKSVDDIRVQVLNAIGEVVWRFTLVDIIVAFVGMLVTAFLTAYLTSRKVALKQIRSEMQLVMDDVKKNMNDVSGTMQKSAIMNNMRSLQDQTFRLQQSLDEINERLKNKQ